MKVDRFPRKKIFSPKKTSKNGLFWRQWIRGILTLGGAVCQTIDPVLVAQSWVSAKKWGPLAKLWSVTKNSIFHWFLLPPTKKKYRARVPTILMPQTFPIASLNRYTPNFAGAPHSWPWPNSLAYSSSQSQETPESCLPKKAVFLAFFWKEKVFLAKRSTITYSYCSSG